MGHFLSQPIMVRSPPFCEGLKEVGNGTQVACTLSLNLSLTACEPYSPWTVSRKLVCSGFFLFSWLPAPLSEETVYLGTPIPYIPSVCLFISPEACRWDLFIIPRRVYLEQLIVHWAFPLNFHVFVFFCSLGWPVGNLLPVPPQQET